MFLGWGRVWRTLMRDDALRQYLTTDAHYPGIVRAFAPLRNVDAWYEAFRVKKGDRNYVKREERVKIWLVTNGCRKAAVFLCSVTIGAMRKSFVCAIALALTVAAHAQGTKTVLATDKQTQITVPESWTTLELNEAAELQVGNGDEEAYVIVLNELKQDLHGWNLEKHSRVTLGNLISSIAFPAVTGPKSIKVGDSTAVQYEIRGAVDDRNIVYIHTTVDGPKYFSQILAWTVSSRADAMRPQLLNVIGTFREVK